MKNNNYIDKAVNEIMEVTKEFNWKYKKLWVENNCIYAETIKQNKNNIVEVEGLYAGSDFDSQAVYNVLHRLREVLDFTGMLVYDNIMI